MVDLVLKVCIKLWLEINEFGLVGSSISEFIFHKSGVWGLIFCLFDVQLNFNEEFFL